MSTGRVCMPLIVSHMPREEYAEALHARSRTGIEADGVTELHLPRLVTVASWQQTRWSSMWQCPTCRT